METKPNPLAILWFETHSAAVFDWLGINRERAGITLRQVAAPWILQGLRGERDSPGGWGKLMSCERFVTEVQAALSSNGFDPCTPGKLSEVWHFCFAIAGGYPRWILSFGEAALKRSSALELLPPPGEEASWRLRWEQQGGGIFGRGGRLIAHKGDPVWHGISDFGIPWPPFGLKDRSVLKELLVREAEQAGFHGPECPVPDGWWRLDR